MVFWQISSYFQSFIEKLERNIIEIVNTKTLKVSYPSNWFTNKDNDMKKVWPSLKIPSPRYMVEDSKSKSRKDVKWYPPIIPFVKLNFDGSSRNNMGRVKVGFYLHDERGNLIEC